MRFRFLAVAMTVAAYGSLVGCANDEGLASLTTSSVTPGNAAIAPRVDPACISLSEQIEQLRKDGVQEKVEKAAARKYKMKSADLAKADQLNKINAEFQTRCSTLPARPQTAQGPAAPGAQVASSGPGGAAATIPQPTVPPKQ
jgi:hypothetical protein